jgi:hypothetical protein
MSEELQTAFQVVSIRPLGIRLQSYGWYGGSIHGGTIYHCETCLLSRAKAFHKEFKFKEDIPILLWYSWQWQCKFMLKWRFYSETASKTLVSNHQTTRHNNKEKNGFHFSGVKSSNYI